MRQKKRPETVYTCILFFKILKQSTMRLYLLVFCESAKVKDKIANFFKFPASRIKL